MRALLLSGGGFRGAIQVPVIEHLCRQYQYDYVYGVSIGAINGVMAAQDDLTKLRDVWDSIHGIGKFMRLKWWWPLNGLYSLKPLRKQLERDTSLNQLQIPFCAGVVSLTDGRYYNLHSQDMSSDEELWNAVHASSSIAGLMEPPTITIDGNQHIGADGGFRNIFPIPEPGIFDAVDIVCCTPLKTIHQRTDINNGAEYISRGVEIMSDEVFVNDFPQIRRELGPEPEITLYVPSGDPGHTFRANKELIQHRYNLGMEALKNPIRL